MSDKKKVQVQFYAVHSRMFQILREMKELEKELDELEEILRGDKNES